MTERNQFPLANTIKDSCTRLSIGRTLLYDLLKQGKLRSIKLGTRTLIPESELQRLVTEQLTQAAAAESCQATTKPSANAFQREGEGDE